MHVRDGTGLTVTVDRERKPLSRLTIPQHTLKANCKTLLRILEWQHLMSTS